MNSLAGLSRVLDHHDHAWTGTADAPVASGSRPTERAPRLPHLRALDGLRGAAVLAVVLYHFSPDVAPGGFLGVDIFFVLSGFLITSLLVSELESNRHISLLAFWARRARRLLPALFLVLGTVGVYALLERDQAAAHHHAVDGLAALGYFANWHFISAGQSYVERIVQHTPSPLRHTWSLAIEEQFYLVWPITVALLGAFVARITARRRRDDPDGRTFRYALVGVCLALGIASFAWLIMYFDPVDPNRVYYGTDTRAFILLIGAAVGALTAGIPTITRRAPRVLLIVAGGGATAALVVTMARLQITDERLHRGGYGLVAVAITLVLVASAQPGRNPLAWIFRSRPLVALGLISYGVYLWHWPVTAWVDEPRTGLHGVGLFALRSVITLTVSIASYLLVEQPIRRGWRPHWKLVKPIAGVAAVVVLLLGLLLVPVVAFSSVNDVPLVSPSRASANVSTTYANAPRCDRSQAIVPRVGAGHRPRVELFGNSVAVEVRNCLATIVGARGATFEAVVRSGQAPCHFLGRLREQVADPATRPDVAIFMAAYLNVESSCDPVDADWLAQVREALGIWAAAGVHVYLVPNVPNVPGTAPPVPTDATSTFVPAQTPEFRAFARQDPAHVTVVDAGTFLRDANGVYQWRMPCVNARERGCGPDRAVGVRWVDGFHFCTDPHWNGHSCVADDAGGERRVAAAIALQITELSLHVPSASQGRT
jgi:peptidoglycan/LPS O-acetylase OafA/YrhL